MDNKELIAKIERGIVEQFYHKIESEVQQELKENNVTDEKIIQEIEQHFNWEVVWSDVFKKHE